MRQRVGSAFRMLDNLQPTAAGLYTDTSVVPPGGSAHILQNDRLSVQHQHVACYEQYRGSGKKLLNPHQSAYCKHHSTETALLYIHDHLINAIGSQKL